MGRILQLREDIDRIAERAAEAAEKIGYTDAVIAFRKPPEGTDDPGHTVALHHGNPISNLGMLALVEGQVLLGALGEAEVEEF